MIMANNLPPLRRFMAEDFREAPKWFNLQFLPALNSFTDPMYTLLDGGVDITQNTKEEIYQTTFTANGLTNNFSFTPRKFRGVPVGVEISQCSGMSFANIPATGPITLDWVNSGTGQIDILKIHNLTAGLKYRLTLRIY